MARTPTTRRMLWAETIVLAAALLAAGCGDGKVKACDPGASGSYCLDNLGNGLCADVSWAPVCVAGQWRCADGKVRQEECRCQGPPPGAGCSCAADGWTCPDATAP